MAIPVATTTVLVERTSDRSETDPWDQPTPSDWTTVKAGVRATISDASGRSGQPGDTETTDFRLQCDPVGLNYADRVTDEKTGLRYDVAWSYDNPGIAGLSSTVAGLTRHQGLVTT